MTRRILPPPPPPGSPAWAESLPPWLPTGAAAALTGESANTILNRIKAGALAARRRPGGWLVERNSLLAYLAMDLARPASSTG